jgi:hypothetical protein
MMTNKSPPQLRTLEGNIVVVGTISTKRKAIAPVEDEPEAKHSREQIVPAIMPFAPPVSMGTPLQAVMSLMPPFPLLAASTFPNSLAPTLPFLPQIPAPVFPATSGNGLITAPRTDYLAFFRNALLAHGPVGTRVLRRTLVDELGPNFERACSEQLLSAVKCLSWPDSTFNTLVAYATTQGLVRAESHDGIDFVRISSVAEEAWFNLPKATTIGPSVDSIYPAVAAVSQVTATTEKLQCVRCWQ